jgi:hypothetical protein
MPASGIAAAEASYSDVERQLGELAARFKAQQDDLIRVRKHLEGVIKKEVSNATRQLESFANVQYALAGGTPLPAMHGWPISPDFAAYLVELIRSNDYDLVVEFGSGTSTVLIAKLLAQSAPGRAGRRPVVQVAFEHLEQFRTQTLDHLRAADLEGCVTVHHAPLVSYRAENGLTYPYYACEEPLATVAEGLDDRPVRALVLVDGPPAVTGTHARYPALPIVMSALPDACLHVLLDDYVRDDEKQIARMWQDELANGNRSFEFEVRTLEKDACLLHIAAPPRYSPGEPAGT